MFYPLSKKLDWAMAFTIATAWLYFLGVMHRNAAFAWLGLRGHISEADFQDLLIEGLRALVGAGTESMTWIALLGGTTMLFGISLALVVLTRCVRVRLALLDRRARAKRKIRIRNSHARNRSDWIMGLTLKALWPIVAFMLFTAVMFGTSILARTRGERAAERFVAKAKQFRYDEHEVVLANGRKLQLGPVIDCTSATCIFWSHDRAILLRRDLIVLETAVPPPN